MTSIKPLAESLINKIAAGEVVERPASVVKELLENSLDAGATEVDIQLEDGGKKSILVRDNGAGIARDELRAALSRHATSKIATLDDLFAIQTLGFRGEALAAMAAVAKLKLTSRSSEVAGELVVEGGEILSEQDVGHARGTTVVVSQLFYKTPARLKFLKSADTELAYISDYVTKAALMHPEVGFKLTHRGRTITLATKTADLTQRITDLFDKDVAQACYALAGGRDGLEIHGMVGHPMISRSHRRHVFLFVNGRPVQDKVLHHAVMEAHRDLLMKGRFPFVVVFLKIPPQMVDVNVHPAKTEVRFAQSQVIHNFVYECLRVRLTAKPWKGNDASLQWNEAEQQGVAASQNDSWDRGPALPCELGIAEVGEIQKQIVFGKTSYAELNVIGQLMGTYILCQAKEKLVLLDQHAAHERIGFEKLLLQYQAGCISTQRLLVPINFDLNPSECEILKKYVEELQKFGFEIDFFGGNTFVTKGVPVLLKKIVVKDLMLDLVGDTLEKGRLTSLSDRLHAVLARMACHAAIRAHDKLELAQMQALIKELDDYQNTSFCPHGRPVSMEVSKYEIERWFKRIV